MRSSNKVTAVLVPRFKDFVDLCRIRGIHRPRNSQYFNALGERYVPIMYVADTHGQAFDEVEVIHGGDKLIINYSSLLEAAKSKLK